MRAFYVALFLVSSLGWSSLARAADYVIDTKDAHASVVFKIQHLGYSWLYGQFKDFSGSFSYDAANPNASKVEVVINTTSLDSNHAERDKHLKSKEYLNASRFPEAKFVSTGYAAMGADKGQLKGDLTLRGVTKPIVIDVTRVGEGKDPWGGYRAGFSGETQLVLADFGITKNLGPASKAVTLLLNVEGIRQ
jgi:polyisoprenoid-binding protein YceI